MRLIDDKDPNFSEAAQGAWCYPTSQLISPSMQSPLASEGASVQLLHQTLAALSNPDASLYADVGEAPAPPTTPEQQQAAAGWAANAALHLQLAAEISEQLDALQLGLHALAAQAAVDSSGGGGRRAGADLGPAGSVRIEELDGGEEAAGDASLVVGAVLTAAQFGADAALQRPWASGQLAAAAQKLLAVLGAKLAAVLADMQQQWQQRQAGVAAGGALLHEVATSRISNSSSDGGSSGQQSPEVQQLLQMTLPAALQRLRPVVTAKVEHSRHKTMRLEPYRGPGNFERCLAAGQLAWLLRQLSGNHLSAACTAALPVVLAAVEDPFPLVQACALWALCHLATEGQAADLRPHSQLLLGATKQALAGCSEVSWPAAAAAAIAVAGRLEGSNPYSQAYHDVMAVLLDEAERSAHATDRAAAWLAAAPPLFPRLGLQLAAHFSRLMPLLLGWCLAVRQSVRAAAMEALLQAVRLTWPRVGAHAAALWRVLRRAHGEELLRASAAATAGSETAARAVADCAADCALTVWFAAGTDFQVQLMTSREGPADELLQAVMQRLEESVPQMEESVPQQDAMWQHSAGQPAGVGGVRQPLGERMLEG